MTNNINILKNPEQDATLKTELKELAESVDIGESNFESINNLFEKINELDESNKQKALQYALYESNIKAGNGTIKLLEIAKIFEENIEQIGDTWKIKAKENAELGDKSELIEKLLNEKESPFAYLIQKSAQLITLHAARGYGVESEEKLAIGIDKVFGNQTRRALEGLKDWVESDLDKSAEEIDVTNLTVEEILDMKFISEKLKNKIELEGNDNIKKLWESKKYQYLRPYTNNYALKNKSVEETISIEGTEEVSGEIPTDPPTKPLVDSTDIVVEVDQPELFYSKEFSEVLLEKVKGISKNVEIDFYGKNTPFTFMIGISNYKGEDKYGRALVGVGYETLSLSTLAPLNGRASIPIEYLVDKGGNFDQKKRTDTILPHLKEKLKENILATQITKELRDKKINKEEVFKNIEVNPPLSDLEISRIKKYFRNFKNEEVWIDPLKTFSQEGNIHLNLNDTGKRDKFDRSQNYNKSINNPDLIISVMEIVNNKGNLDEQKFKEKLISIFRNIVKNNKDIII